MHRKKKEDMHRKLSKLKQIEITNILYKKTEEVVF